MRPHGRRSNDTSAVQGEFWQERGPIAPITEEPAASDQVLTLAGPEAEQSSLADLEHPVTAYLNGLDPSSRRPQLAALEAIARRSTQVFSAETMAPSANIVLLQQAADLEHLGPAQALPGQPATANRMLSALRGVLKEWAPGPRAGWAAAAPERVRSLGDLQGVRPKAGIHPLAPHDLLRTWTGGLLEAGVDLGAVQKMAWHASVSTTGRDDRRDHAVQETAAGCLRAPYVEPQE